MLFAILKSLFAPTRKVEEAFSKLKKILNWIWTKMLVMGKSLKTPCIQKKQVCLDLARLTLLFTVLMHDHEKFYNYWKFSNEEIMVCGRSLFSERQTRPSPLGYSPQKFVPKPLFLNCM